MTVKVLVVDDDVDFARVIEQILARRGYDVR
jgi:CheY-like chemotaxis protein